MFCCGACTTLENAGSSNSVSPGDDADVLEEPSGSDPEASKRSDAGASAASAGREEQSSAVPENTVAHTKGAQAEGTVPGDAERQAGPSDGPTTQDEAPPTGQEGPIRGRPSDLYMEPIPGAEVYAGEAQTTTDANGEFTFDHVSGVYDLEVHLAVPVDWRSENHLWFFHGLQRCTPAVALQSVAISGLYSSPC